MAKRVLVTLASVVLVLLVVGMFLPHEYTLRRSLAIHADRAHVHALTNHLARWREWAPWEQGDATMQRSLTGKARGVGATQTWFSDEGGGRVTITSSDELRGVEYDIVFVNHGHESLAHGAMSYEPEGDGTMLTWRLDGVMDVPVTGGWLACFAGPLVGPKLEEGLRAIAAKAEAH
jgi:hypothetical protein